ncbi:unnamed protein product [Orchesella dallaii]|uniref:Helicase ATP-binding domain-containing protein n=1 Tax=Orchesella dallaii TaxID=48710 RepID=A0ABP1PZT6_9HEXA
MAYYYQEVPDIDDEMEMDNYNVQLEMEQIIDAREFINNDDEPFEVEAAEPFQQAQHIIEGVPISFPGQPTENQITMMENIIRSLKNERNNSNVLIESPTGSGKTLAFLCAVLAWVKYQNEQVGGDGDQDRERHRIQHKIYYTTKTHSQVSTVIKELRKTSYAAPNNADPNSALKVAILGSRQQMCTNLNVLQSPTRDDDCKRLEANFERNQAQGQGQQAAALFPTCEFYKREFEDCFNTTEGRRTNGIIMDIEDMSLAAIRHRCCSFFGSRRQLPSADIVICPYNYLISSHIRNSLGIDPNNRIVVFDEAHNLENACCEEGSISVSSQNLEQIWKKCDKIANHPQAGSLISNKMQRLSAVFRRLSTWLSSQVAPKVNAEIITAFQDQLGLGPEHTTQIQNDVNFVINTKNIHPEVVLDTKTAQQIRKFVTVLQYLYTRSGDGIGDGDNDDNISKNYLLTLENIPQGHGSPSNSTTNSNPKLSIICINPSIVFRGISNQAYSIMVTSGTLSPLATFSRELGIPFESPLSLGQAISRRRYWIGKIGRGPNDVKLTLNFASRGAPEILKEIGEFILNVCQAVPNGVLVFVPSKQYLKDMKVAWEARSTIMIRIQEAKVVICETDMSTPELTRFYLNEYRTQSRGRRGAVLFGIHGGKLSEGVDYKDEEARVVISLGIPYAPRDAPDVSARRFSWDNEDYWRWYTGNAIRAVSQCLGRSVRHERDWGAVIMVDQRFIEKADAYEGLMPPWIEDAANTFNHFDDMIRNLQAFVTSVNGP